MTQLWGPVWWMAGPSVVVWLVTTLATHGRLHPELLLGMAAPLLVAITSWAVMRVTFGLGPERLMGAIVQLFAAKMVLFGAYVTIMLRMFHLRPVPFIVSFAAYFIALYAMEAVFLRRLLMHGSTPPPTQAH
ncbi:MAG: hypothetical protein ABI051_17825 [Vicinamibacterales bacterium]